MFGCAVSIFKNPIKGNRNYSHKQLDQLLSMGASPSNNEHQKGFWGTILPWEKEKIKRIRLSQFHEERAKGEEEKQLKESGIG